MISLLLFASLFFSSAQQLQVFETEVNQHQLSTELIYSHPALLSGDMDTFAADLLTAIENDYKSDLLAEACYMLNSSNQLANRVVSSSRVARLIELSNGSTASDYLVDAFYHNLERSRFQLPERLPFREDLRSNWISNWHVANNLGDFGRQIALDQRLLSPSLEDAKQWHAIQRSPHSRLISPTTRTIYTTGYGVATTFFKSTVGPAILHLTCDEFAVVKFNGVKIFDHTEFNNYNRPTHLMYQVPVAEGYNQLSVYYEVDSNPLIGAKLLNLDGSYRAVRELPSDSSLPAIPDRPNFKPVRTPVFATIESQSPFDAIRNVHLLALENRAAEALAIAEPEEMDLHQTLAWLNARWFALASSNHFSSSIVRRMQRELFERISSNGYYLHVPFTDELSRLISEDQIETALEACDLWLVDLPRRPHLIEAQIECLSHFDPSLSLAKKELEQLLIDAPYRSYAYDKLIKLAEQQQNYQYKLELLERSVQFTGSNSSSLIRFLLQGDSAQVDRGLAMIDRILDEHPNSPLAESLLASHYSKTDALRTKAEFTAELAQRHPHDFNLQLDLLSSYYSMDKLDDAIAVLDSLADLSPSSPEVIKWQRLLHNSTIYDSFFSDFAPDSEAVLANRDINTGDAQFPTSSLLDSALRFVFADNGYITRSHTITRINNSQGALDYGTQEVSGNPIHMRVIKANGDIFEAHQVDGTWVLPTLEQGDLIDSKNEYHHWGSPGLANISGTTTFKFFNLPKKSVSAIYYIDDQANGQIRSFNTNFEPEIHDYATGKVHVYKRQDAAALIPEAFMPNPDSFVPGVQYGFDVSLENSANRLFSFMRRLTDCPADIELQLQAWLKQLNLQGNQHQRAIEIYWAVQDHIIDFESFNDIIDTFTLREGRPIGLLSKLFELNGISHEWAFVAGTAPHLDNSQPVFDVGEKFQYPALRLPPTVAGEQPLWVFSLEHNAPIGMGYADFYGADVLVIGRDFHRVEKFEPHPANEIRNIANIHYYINADGNAEVSGDIHMLTMQGAMIRKQLKQLSPDQIKQAELSFAGRYVDGLDVSSGEFYIPQVDDNLSHYSFTGQIPNFVQARGERFGGRLRFPLSTSIHSQLGESQREFDFEFNERQFTTVKVRISCAENFTMEYSPESRNEQVSGFSYSSVISKAPREITLTLDTELDGIKLESTQFPDFLILLQELEKQEMKMIEFFKHNDAAAAEDN